MLRFTLLVSALGVASLGWPTLSSAQLVVLDPGHGGSDPGAVGNGLQEDDVVLDISLRAADALRAQGLRVALTRQDSRTVSLSGRTGFANARGADLFVSVHANSNAGTPATGTETFVAKSASSTSVTLGTRVQQELITTWTLRNRGLKRENFFVVRKTRMPAALAELAFINRTSPDAERLRSPGERQRIAEALARAVLKTLGRMTVPNDACGNLIPCLNSLSGVACFDDGFEEIAECGVASGSLSCFDRCGARPNPCPAALACWRFKGGGACFRPDRCAPKADGAPAGVGGLALGLVFEDEGLGVEDSSLAIEGARIMVRETGDETLSDEQGRFGLELPPGAYTLEVEREGFAPAVRECEVTGDGVCLVAMPREENVATLQGVVHLADDPTQRVVGARIALGENGAVSTSGAESGYWSIEVPPGVYTVDVVGEGFETTRSTCVVPEAGAEVWCMVGVTPNGEPLELVENLNPLEEAAPDAPKASGCAAGGRSPAGVLLALLMLMVLRRRRQNAFELAQRAVLCAALPLLAIGCAEVPAGEASRALREDMVQVAVEVPSFISLEAPKVLAEGDFSDVALSPQARRLALGGPAFEGLELLDLRSGERRMLTLQPGAGFEPRWRTDGAALGLHGGHLPSSLARLPALDLEGHAVAPLEAQTSLQARTHDAGIVLRREGRVSLIAPPGDRYFAPRVSPDEAFVVFRGISTGLYLHRMADGVTIHLGEGSHARFAGDDLLVFERVADDGHAIVEGTLYVADLSDAAIHVGPIAGTGEGIRRAPSPASGRIAFLRGNEVVLGGLQRTR